MLPWFVTMYISLFAFSIFFFIAAFLINRALKNKEEFNFLFWYSIGAAMVFGIAAGVVAIIILIYYILS